MFRKLIAHLLIVATILTSCVFFVVNAENSENNKDNYITVKNENIYYERLGNTSSNKTIIFVHGASATAESLRPLAMNLSDYNVILLDLPGHYRSEGTARSTIKDYTDFIKDFIKALRSEGIVTEDITLIGHSMGGMITLQSSINHDVNEIKRYVIVNSGAKVDVDQGFIDKLAQGIYDYSFFSAAFTPYTPQYIIDYFMANLDSMVASVEASYADFKTAAEFDGRDQLDKVKDPTLILGAELDRITPIALSHEMDEGIEDSELITYSEVGHMLPVEKADIIAQDIIKFIESK